MDPFTLREVTRLFTRLTGKVLTRVILRLSEQSPINPSFDVIDGKLSANSFATPFDFALDVRLLFSEATRTAGPDRPACLAIADLAGWFESHLQKLPRTPDEQLHTRLVRGQESIQVVRRAMALHAFRPETDFDPPPKVAPNRRAPAPLIVEIQQMMTEVTTPDIQVKLMAVVRKHFPDLAPADTVTLPAADITLVCAEEMRSVLTQALEEQLARPQTGTE
jgi:hypothetical protein